MLRLKSYSDGYNNENEPVSPASPTPYPSRSPSLSHSNWPFPHLDTIVERSDSRSLRSIASAPKLRSSPQRCPRLIRPKDSIRSIHPLQSQSVPWPLKQPLPTTHVSNYKSFSAPDLDCMEKPFAYRRSQGSSSSSQALKCIPTNPAGPARPIVEPTYRHPTPDGLPPFGSKEAQELRLHPEPAFKRGARALAHWIRGERETSNEVLSEGSPASLGSMSSSNAQDRSVPMDMLQRLFGTSRVVEAPEPADDDRPRAGLPRGISIAGSPGILATAPDGTCVRGRFGARMSAHGVGSRTLAHHPLVGGPEQKSRTEQSRTEGRSRASGSRTETAQCARSVERTTGRSREARQDHSSRHSTVLSSRTRGQSSHGLPPVPLVGSPVMREPGSYSPSVHDRAVDGSGQTENWNMPTTASNGARGRSNGRSQREQSEKDEGGYWHTYCLQCCDRDLNETEEERTQRRQEQKRSQQASLANGQSAAGAGGAAGAFTTIAAAGSCGGAAATGGAAGC